MSYQKQWVGFREPLAIAFMWLTFVKDPTYCFDFTPPTPLKTHNNGRYSRYSQ